MKIAVIGGGINGLSSAWQLALAGYDVSLFERDSLMQATSAASSKLLHGGLRYLEQGEFRLVREALQERRWWLKKAPQLTRRLPILYPFYNDSRRARWQLKIGLWRLLANCFGGFLPYPFGRGGNAAGQSDRMARHRPMLTQHEPIRSDLAALSIVDLRTSASPR